MIPFPIRAALVAALLVLPGSGRAQGTDSLSISVQDAVTMALRSSDEARLAVAQTRIAGAQVATARSLALPTLRLNSSYSHVYESARGNAVGSVFNQPNTYNVNAALSQTLFQGGREIAGWRAARRLAEATQLSEAETRAQIALDVQRAYLQALYTDQTVDIRATTLQLASNRVTQVEQFQNAGRAARYDVLRARVERANLEPLVIQARQDRDLALLELKRILNIPPAQPVRLTTKLDGPMVQALLTSNLDSGTYLDRASIRAAELTARARRDAVTAARADYFPTITATFQLGYQAFPLGNAFPRAVGSTIIEPTTCPYVRVDGNVCTRTTQNGGFFQDKSVGLTVSWPIFDGFRTKANIDLARAQAEQAEIQLSQQREAAAIEVERARSEVQRSRALFAARQQNSSEATEAFSLASLRFTRGLSTQLEVSDAQLALLTAQTDEARATYDLYLASAALARALGRPIPLPPGSGTPVRTTSKSESSAPATSH